MATFEEAVDEINKVRAAEPLLQSSPKRTTIQDPDFLQSFFPASRLHFIGAWREKWETKSHRVARDAPRLRAGEERVIFHVDLDCFFAAVAVKKYPGLRGRPVAVCWGDSKDSTSEVSSASYEARAFGIKAGMFVRDALKKCPDLTTVPFDFEAYVETALDAWGCVLAVTPHVVGLSIDECFADVTEVCRGTTVDAVAARLRADIRAKTECAASVGSGPNMLVARIATKDAKPDGHVHGDATKLRHMPASVLPDIGPRRARALADVGVVTCGDLLEADVAKVLGDNLAAQARKMAQGIDDRPWTPKPPRKSVSAQCSFGVRASDLTHAKSLVAQLCNEVWERATRYEVTDIVTACVLKVWRATVDNDGTCKGGVGHGRCEIVSRTAAFDKARVDLDDVNRLAVRLFVEYNIPPEDLRGLGVALDLKVVQERPKGQPAITELFAKPQVPRSIAPSTHDEVPAPTTKRRRRRGLVVVPVGLPGSGKSTYFAEFLADLGATRVCQDVLGNRARVETKVKDLIKTGASVFVDRTNYNSEQRSHWLKIARDRDIPCVALVFDVPAATCVKRAAKRTHHEGRLDARDPVQCRKVVNKLDNWMKPIEDSEGFARVFRLASDADMDTKRRLARQLVDAVDLSPGDSKKPRIVPRADAAERTTKAGAAWTCAACTLVNEKPLGLVCEACLTPRYGQQRQAEAPPIDTNSSLAFGGSYASTFSHSVAPDDEPPLFDARDTTPRGAGLCGSQSD